MSATSSLAAELEPVERTEALGGRALVRELLEDRTALVGLIILVVMFGLALLAPLIAPYDPNAQDIFNQFKAPTLHHLLGTDQFGRDEFSRLLFGARVSLFTSAAVGITILAIGVVVGTVSG